MSRKAKPSVKFPPPGRLNFDEPTGGCDSDGLADMALLDHTHCAHGSETPARYIPRDPQRLELARTKLRKHRQGRRQ
jgi:hypothetical protein